ncbi:MATE family efflux transporter [Treponema sp.]
MKSLKLFQDKAFYRSLFTLAIPISLQSLINSSVNMADTVMIGRLGTVEIASVGLGNQVFFLFTMLLFGIGSGGTVFTAQYWGKQDIEGIRRTTGICLVFSFITATFFTLVSLFAPSFIISLYSNDPAVISAGSVYLRGLAPSFIPFAVSFVFTLIMRSVEKVRLSIVATIISLSINVVLNACLIFGLGIFPRMGVAGAALATVIARYVEVLILVGSSYRLRYVFTGSFKELFNIKASSVRYFLLIALPVMVNELLWSLGITMQNVVFARTGTNAIAAFNITSTVSQLTWVAFIGLGNGAAVLIGKKIGQSDELQARSYAGLITRFMPLLAAAVALILIPLSWSLPYLFKVEPSVFHIINRMFIILALSYPFRAFNMAMIIGVCRAGGDTIFSVVYDVAVMWVITLPLAALASFLLGAPVWLVYLCVAMEDPLKMLLGVWRLRSGKWLHNVTGK